MVVVPETMIVEKGRLGPGQMIAVDLEEGRLFHDREVKDRIAGEHDYAALIGKFKTLDDFKTPKGDCVTRFDRAELMRRQVAAGQTIEDMELILSPMVETAKEAIGSMGDDTPLAVISDKPRLISQFFRQNFSQVTNPPIDSLRERHVMSLKTRFSNLANILDTDGAQDGVLVLESPVLDGKDWAKLKAHFGGAAAEIDCTFAAGGDPEALRAAIQRIRNQAEQAVREGKSELFLSDRGDRRGKGRHRRGAGGGGGAHAPRAARLALLLLDQHRDRRMPRHALLRGADRGRRDDGLRVSGRGGGGRPAWARAVRSDDASTRPSPTIARRSTKDCSRSCRRWGSR